MHPKLEICADISICIFLDNVPTTATSHLPLVVCPLLSTKAHTDLTEYGFNFECPRIECGVMLTYLNISYPLVN